MVNVKKKNGELQEFDAAKIMAACERAGTPREVAQEIVNNVREKTYEGIPTSEIRTMVLEELSKRSEESATKFREFKKE